MKYSFISRNDRKLKLVRCNNRGEYSRKEFQHFYTYKYSIEFHIHHSKMELQKDLIHPLWKKPNI